MTKKISQMAIEILAEGQRLERSLERSMERERIEQASQKLVRGCPIGEADRTMYIRSVVLKALRGEVSQDVFKLFAQRTNAWLDIENMLPRAKKLR